MNNESEQYPNLQEVQIKQKKSILPFGAFKNKTYTTQGVMHD